jgi:O-antigen ligase
MAARAVWRPPWQAWTLLGLAALALTPKLAPGRLHGSGLVLTPLLILAGILLLRKLWELNPAINACAAIVLTIFSGAWFQLGLRGFPLDRMMLLLVVLQMLLRAPGIVHTPRIQIRDVHLVMGLTIVYVLASGVAAKTLSSEGGFLTLIDTLGLAPYLMFLMTPAIFAGRRERDMLLVTLVGLGAYLGLTAIFESLGPHSLVFPHYIAQVDAELPNERAGGPFQSSSAEGFATYACAVAAAIAFIQWRGQRKRFLAAAVAAVCLGGCFVTLERGVWLAAVVATVVTALATRAGRRLLVPAALVCALALGAALTVSSDLSNKTSNRVNDQTSVWSRENQTSAGLRMLAAKPLFGFGLARWKTDSLPYFRQPKSYPQNGYMLAEGAGSVSPPLPLHDTYLAFAVELGAIGLLLWLATLVLGVGGAIVGRGPRELRLWKLGLLAVATFYVVVAIIDPHEQSFSPLLLWSWAGLAVGSASLSTQLARARVRSGKPRVELRSAIAPRSGTPGMALGEWGP